MCIHKCCIINTNNSTCNNMTNVNWLWGILLVVFHELLCENIEINNNNITVPKAGFVSLNYLRKYELINDTHLLIFRDSLL